MPAFRDVRDDPDPPGRFALDIPNNPARVAPSYRSTVSAHHAVFLGKGLARFQMTFDRSDHPVKVVGVKDAFPTFMRPWKLAGRVSQLFVYVGEPEEAPALYVPLVDEAVPALGDRAESMRILEQRLTQPRLAAPPRCHRPASRSSRADARRALNCK